MWLQVAKTKVAMQSWHGSLRPRRYWNLAHIGRGTDQYGPGWYFTSNEDTAKTYGRYVHSCTIDLSEANAADQIGEAIEYEDQIEQLIAKSPGFQTNYYDWDDNRSLETYQNLMFEVIKHHNSVASSMTFMFNTYRRCGNAPIHYGAKRPLQITFVSRVKLATCIRTHLNSLDSEISV